MRRIVGHLIEESVAAWPTNLLAMARTGVEVRREVPKDGASAGRHRRRTSISRRETAGVGCLDQRERVIVSLTPSE